MTRARHRAILLVAASLLACDGAAPGGGDRADRDDRSPAAPLRVGREVRLAGPGDAVRFGFHDGGDAFIASAPSHDASVADGALHLVPRHLGQAGAAIELETTSAARGDRAIDLTLVGSAINGESGGLEVRRAGITERFESFDGAVEQSWRFERAPAGQGDLVVEVAALGHDYSGTTERGLHFARSGGLGFRYGHATWVAADGSELAIAARYEAGAIRLVVPDEVVAATAYPATLDPVVEPEVAVDRPVVGGTGEPSDQVDVAWSGSQYLAVWRQDIQADPYGYEVRAARVAADGTVLDRRGITVGVETSQTPAVVSFGGSYLVAYRQTAAIALARVGVDGTVQQFGAIGSYHPNAANERPDIAARAGEAMIAYYESGSYRNIWAVPYIGGAAGPEAQVATGARSGPRIAADPGGNYAVVWTDANDDVRCRFVSPTGVPGTEVVLSSSGAAVDADPSVAFTGGGFAVVWQRRTIDSQQIWGVRVGADGTVGSPVAVSSLAAAAAQPSIACDTTCQVLWSGGPDPATVDLRGRRLDADLTPVGAEVVVVDGAGSQGPGALAGVSGSYYLAWADAQSGVIDAYGAPASPAGDGLTLGSRALLATADNIENAPAVAGNVSAFLVGWEDTRNSGSDLFGKRFSADGIEKTVKARAIFEGPGRQGQLALAWSGSQYLAAWHSKESPGVVQVGRIGRYGELLDPAGVTLGSGNSLFSTDVAAGGAGDWLVSWTRNFPSTRRLLVARVSPDGTPSLTTRVSDDTTTAVAVARDPVSGVYVVAWFMATPGELRAARIAPDGTLLDLTPVTLATAVPGGRLDMAAGGGVLLLAWPSDALIQGMRIAVTGGGIQVLSPGVVVLAADGASRVDQPALAFTAKGFLMAYERRSTLNGNDDIYGAQIGANGVVQGAPFVISANSESEGFPAIAGAGQGRALVAYHYGATASGPYRVYVRSVTALYPAGATCTDGGQCESGFCTDNRCCDSACGGGADDCQACSINRGAAIDGVCAVLEAGTVCRRYADVFCDRRETCDGVSTDCPPDLGRHEGEVCDDSCGAVCPLADESGIPHVCPVCP